jgi:hypothetical protein
MSTDRPDPPIYDPRDTRKFARAALDALKAVTHLTAQTDGLTDLAETREVLGSFAGFAALLPQTLAQIDRRLLDWRSAGHLGTDRGTEFGGRPASAMATARNALWHGCDDAVALYDQLDTAVHALRDAQWTGPEPGQP